MLQLVPFRLAYDRKPTRNNGPVRAGRLCFAIQHKETKRFNRFAYVQQSFALVVLETLRESFTAHEIACEEWLDNIQNTTVSTIQL